MRFASTALALLVLVATGCASGGAAVSTTSGEGAEAQAARPARGTLNLIPNAEVEAAGGDILNAYDLVYRLRPSMMRYRNQTAGTTSSGEVTGPIAYVDDVRLGALDLLRTVMRATVKEIRFISPTDATTRWGTGHSNGVVQVITKR